jgi:large subunit ribosomal protein L22
VTGVKTNERPGTRAVLRHYRMSAYKARQVLDLVRGMDVDRAREALESTPREAARVVAKVLASAVANARHNEQLDPEDLYVSACFADEGTTLKRWRPRARGRATRIRKRTCHITVIVSRLPDDRLERRRARRAAETTAMRSRRVAASRRGSDAGEGQSGRRTAADADDAVTTEGDLEDVVDVDTDGVETDEVDTDQVDTADVDTGDAEADDAETDAVVESGVDAVAEAEVAEAAVVEAEAEAEHDDAPAPARRARAARKTTKKAAAQADDGADTDAGGEAAADAPDEEEKG